MSAAIDFYFDFSSPYGYLTSVRIEELAARYERRVCWRPFLLGVLFQATGRRPLLEQPLIGEYAAHDMVRTARLLGVPFQLPEPFPVATLAACRAFYALCDNDEATAIAVARALFHGYFADGRNISEISVVLAISKEQGIDAKMLAAAIATPTIKERLRRETEAAAARKVFGSPFIIVDGEPFWGNDRLPDVDQWLASGGW